MQRGIHTTKVRPWVFSYVGFRAELAPFQSRRQTIYVLDVQEWVGKCIGPNGANRKEMAPSNNSLWVDAPTAPAHLIAVDIGPKVL